jgi:ABC-type transport system involved in cytochrome bd biosynthesis fused ATPase/permease subunit
MSLYWIKTSFAVLLLGAGCGAFFTMMARFGRSGDEARAERLRRAHKTFGYLYMVLLIPLVVAGSVFLVRMGGGLSVRAALHFFVAVTLLAVLLLKYLSVKTHRQMMRFSQALGMTLFAITLVIFLMMAGYYTLLAAAGA